MISFQSKLLSFFSMCACSVLFLSCQEDSLSTELIKQDQDMLKAESLADQYLSQATPNGRSSIPSSAVTVLTLQENGLYYITNTDTIGIYNEVREETITAFTNPGDVIFWYAGEGIGDLEGIEFDKASLALLDEAPEEIYPNLMWKVTMPDTIASEGITLKYDILYKTSDSTEVIRLDPKLKTQPRED